MIAKLIEKFAAITIGIGEAMSEVYFIIVIFELNLKSQGVIKTTTLLLHTILIVANIHSISLPTIAILV